MENIEVFVDSKSTVEMIKKTAEKPYFHRQRKLKRESCFGPAANDFKKADVDNNAECLIKLTGYVRVTGNGPLKKRLKFGQVSLVNVEPIVKTNDIPQLDIGMDIQQENQKTEQVQAILVQSKLAHSDKNLFDSNDNITAPCTSAHAKNHDMENAKVQMDLNATMLKNEPTEEISWSEMSTSEINDFIKTESGKSSPNWDRLSDAMTITYEPIRKIIYDRNDVSTEDIKKFPGLEHFEMVKEEYGRILGDVRKMSKLEQVLKPKLISALKTYKLKLSSSKNALQIHEKHRLEIINSDTPENLGMLLFCYEHAGEHTVVADFFKFLEPGQNVDGSFKISDTPTIVVQKEYDITGGDSRDMYIYVDCKNVLRVPNLYEAVLSSYALYYVYNIVYDVQLEGLFKCFDRLSNDKTRHRRKNEEKCTFCESESIFQ